AAQSYFLGKVANFQLAYRAYPKTFRRIARVQYNIPMELPEAQRIHRTYQKTYTQVPRYWERAIERAKQLDYVETLAGRRVQLVGNWSGDKAWSMESTALNYPIQGTGADQKYLALKVLKDYLLDVHGLFAWDLHDGIYLYIPDNMVDRVVDEGKVILDNLPYQEAWGFVPPIPMPWDVKAGKSWGSLKEITS
ncbi:MAG: DNA polymerase, partial [bacterium]|nr:DNA polymerase [bacterium]